MAELAELGLDIDRERFDHKNPVRFALTAGKGLTRATVELISKEKNEPEWMLRKRLKALEHFSKTPVPRWGPDLSRLDLNDITYYAKPDAKTNAASWSEVPEQIKRTFERLGIPEAERKSLAGAGTQYECITGDSTLFTNPRGPAQIKDITPGMHIFALDEATGTITQARVIGVKCSGKKEVYEITTKKRKIKASKNHPFFTLSYERKPGKRRGIYKKIWKPLENLKEGDLIAVARKYPDVGESVTLPKVTLRENVIGSNQFGVKYNLSIKHLYNQVNIPERSNEDLMWFFGMYVGDGWIHRNAKKPKAAVEIATPEEQKDLREELIRVVTILFGENLIGQKRDRIIIYSTIIAKFIEMCGFTGKALTKVLPDWVYQLPLSERLAFIAGYLDSDGYVRDHPKNHDIVFTSGNKSLLESIRNLCIYSNFEVSKVSQFTSKHPYDKNRRITAYRMNVSGNISPVPSRYKFKRDRLRLKKYAHSFISAKGMPEFGKYCTDYLGFLKIQSIQKVGEEEVYDIEVENYHNFIANGLVVHNSEVVYHNLKQEWEKKGVIFENADVALQKYPELFEKYFMTRCVPITDHKFAMLHAAVWSGGTFIYVPPGVKVTMPLQAYFRMNAPGLGQFEHTLIIADKGAEVNYVEGCSAPRYNVNNIHAGCVEIYVHEGARVRYNSVENWSKNTYNLNTKRAIVEANGTIEWINGNMGCLTGDSKIFTNPRGPIKIKDIDEGDHVYVWDESSHLIKKSIVKNKIFSGNKTVYTLEAGGRSIEASGNHPFLTLQRIKKHPAHKKSFFAYKWQPLENLNVGDVVAITKQLPLEGRPYALPGITQGKIVESKNQYSRFTMSTSYLYNDIALPAETNEDFMWLAGLLIGDGHVDVTQNKINLAVHERDDYREYICSLLKKEFNYTVTEKKERYIIINSKVLCELFTALGIAGTADTKRVPLWVFTLPRTQILSFLAGYFDADGHVERGGVYLTSVSRNLLEGVYDLALSVGFGVSRIFRHGHARRIDILGNKCNAKDSWRLLLNGKLVKELPSRSSHKRNKLEKSKTKRNFVSARGLNFRSKVNEYIGFATVQKIQETGIKPTYDIEVSGTHNFVANGFLVHNSNVTMLYPCSVLKGAGARSDFLGIAFAGDGQNQDTGAKVFHLAPNTTSVTRSKSISKDGGINTFRGLLKVVKGASSCKATVQCDALLLDEASKSHTIPTMEIQDSTADIAHEATVGKIGQEQLFYLMSRGLKEEEAMKLIVCGFVEPIVKALPLEYAVELNRLIQLEMDNAIG